MSKMDNLRAMREARYERATAQPAKKAAPRPRVAPQVEPEVAPTSSAESADDGLCGHRNMSGRSCTRDRGHSEKSHRYS